jgi:hypothetical protein
MSLAIVTTTINVPTFLEAYCRDIMEHDRRDVILIVVGDKKTPDEVSGYCKALTSKYGLPTEYYDIERQIAYLRAFPELERHLPFNSVQRRNIGMVRAYQLGADTILTVDDDNYLREPDLLRCHARVGEVLSLPAYHSSTGWFNPCAFLSATPSIPFYHRGFPLRERWKPAETKTIRRKGKLAVNVGMWLGDPDVDAWVRMALPIDCSAWNGPRSFTLGEDTWAPFNSQQTALAREIIPAYFLDPNAGRYDDIWASYTVHRIAGHLGHLISYGSPIVDHIQKRSVASLLRDLSDEQQGASLTDAFVQALKGAPLRASSYADCYSELAEHLSQVLHYGAGLERGSTAFLRTYVKGMRMWSATIAKLGA